MSGPLLVVLLGPTASGKTALSLYLAEQLGGEIVNCDSVAVYREFEIGTAKPSPAERNCVPHHLIDIASPTEQVTAGDYSRLARQAIREIAMRGRLPIVVGGSGLYLRALLEGLFAGPPRSEELRNRLRERVEEQGSEHLHKILRRLDPVAAKSIHANDVPKAIRAIEVSMSARTPMTQLWQEGREPLRGFNILRIGLNPEREALYQRINARAKGMFSAGLIEETQSLAARYGASARPLTSLGYRQAMQYLEGEISLETAITTAQQGHRNYAKRQMTWFRREPNVHWIKNFGDDPEAQREIFAWIGRQSSVKAE
ncbi:MAG TPA: tRNA (adenosine(37)-N6)-dimethylallyltransferase MiaA [Candidatus Angelobacter sp.]|nr:tRNA (adenosine(37)-N6)-dimethylallyltransferase MiaA [Candidatus Angelobacter sp.]